MACLIPGPAVGDGREFAALHPGEDATAGGGAEVAEVGAEDTGERRRDWYPAPFADRAGLEVPVVAALSVQLMVASCLPQETGMLRLLCHESCAVVSSRQPHAEAGHVVALFGGTLSGRLDVFGSSAFSA